MICQSCGTSNSDSARFCSSCGAEQRAYQASSAELGSESEEITRLRSRRRDEAATLVDTNSDRLVGSTVAGKYRLNAKLGAGGMGAVYRATRLLIGDEVAVKLLHAEQTDPQAGERFRREAQAAARLKHPNAVSIHDFGTTDDGLQYLVMELIAGESLRQIIKQQGPLTPSASAEIVFQVCAALDEAHRHHIIHRDVKPDNIMVQPTPAGLRVKVLDFGIAKLRDDAAGNLTQTGSILGTPHYMSPEQCLGEELDARSDIYSLGIVLYEMLTGVVPFNSPTSSAVVVQQVTQPPPSPRAMNMSISQSVEQVVLRALQKAREARPQTAGTLADELTAAVRGPAVAAANLATDIASSKSQPIVPTNTDPTVVVSKPVWVSAASTGPQFITRTVAGVPARSSSTSHIVGLTALATVVVLGLGSVGAWVLMNRNSHPRDANNLGGTSSRQNETASAPEGTTRIQSADPRNQPSKQESSPQLSNSELGNRQAPVGNTFVVLGSYPKTERAKADERLNFVRAQGYDARIVDTDNYQSLRNGLWAVVMGPYSKDYAKEMARKLRPVIRDTYVK